jgi:hypothetical protein
MSDGAWLAIMEKTQQAVYDYARAEIRSLTRRAIYRLQRVEPSGIYGGDYRFKSLWAEYRHEVQEGPHEQLEDAWNDVLAKTLNEIVDSIPRQTAALLTILAAHDIDEDEGADLIGSVWKEGIVRLLLEGLADEAGGRALVDFL